MLRISNSFYKIEEKEWCTCMCQSMIVTERKKKNNSSAVCSAFMNEDCYMNLLQRTKIQKREERLVVVFYIFSERRTETFFKKLHV